MSYQRRDAESAPPGASLTDLVVEAVADERGVETTALDPLYEVVEPDALDRLFDPRPGGQLRTTGRVVFEMAGCEVTVRSDGEVEVAPADDGSVVEGIPAGSSRSSRADGGPVPESRG